MLRFDFRPGHDRPGAEPLEFGEPSRTVVATTLDEVVGALHEVDEACADGAWATGFVAYDAAPAFDPALVVPAEVRERGTDAAALPLVWFALHEAPVEPGATAPSGPGEALPVTPDGWRASTTRPAYEAAFERVQRAIRRGETYQTNLTVQLTSPWDDGATDAQRYEHLLAAQGGPCGSFGAYLDLGRHHVLSVSPELFFARSGGVVTTRPMKGTARRGRSSEEDEAALAALRRSVKDRAENVMITDLLRNDLGRVAVPGTVAVPALCVPERYRTVWQLTSTVTAVVPPERGLAELFGALFPCGSITGAPKVATMALVADLETTPRGLYCGAVGVVGPGGDATFSVAIRTLVADTWLRTATYGVGSGITVDSTPAAEHDELLAKAAVLAAPVVPPFDLLETLRLEDGAWWQQPAHVRRLARSAAYFGRPDPVEAASQALGAVVAEHPQGRWRVRLLVGPDGAARTEAAPLPETPGTPLTLALAVDPVDPDDVFLAHKTTWRQVYDVRREHRAGLGADDTLLWNTRGEVTETTTGNVALRVGEDWWTPPVACGLLPGVERELALAEGRLVERVLTVATVRGALARGGELWLLNSVRGWRRARLLQ